MGNERLGGLADPSQVTDAQFLIDREATTPASAAVGLVGSFVRARDANPSEMRLSRSWLRASPDAPENDGRHALSIYWDHMNGWGWMMMMIFWSLLWIGFLGLIARLAVQWSRNSSQSSPASQPSDKTARELLDERLARGEIDLDEYGRRSDAFDRHYLGPTVGSLGVEAVCPDVARRQADSLDAALGFEVADADDAHAVGGLPRSSSRCR